MLASTRAERVTSAHRDEVVAFLDNVGRSAPMVLGYHYPENTEMLEEVLRPQAEACHFGLRDDSGRLRALLLGFLSTSESLACYNSLPFFGPNSGVITDFDDEGRAAALLTSAALDYARERGALTAVFYSPFNPEGRAHANPVLEEAPNAIRVPRETQYLVLPDSGSPRWNAKLAYDLRKARKSGVQITDGLATSDVDDVFRIYQDNCEEHGIPIKPRACIERLVACGATASSRIRGYGARLEGRLIGALLVWHGPRTASYYLPCSEAEHRALQATSLLIDHACGRAVETGIRYWNWERSPERGSGVHHFKRKWGSLECAYEVVVVPLAELQPLRELGREEVSRRFPFFYVFPFDRL